MFKQYINLLYLIAFGLFFASCGGGNNTDNNQVIESDTLTNLALIEKQIMNNPDDAELYFGRANIFQEKGLLLKAQEDIKKSIKIDSNNSAYYYLQGELLFKTRKIGLANKSFEKSIEKDAQNTDALLKLAEIKMYLREYGPGIELINKALKVNEFIPNAYFLKGYIYEETGDSAKAASSYITATEMNPNYYQAWYQLGNLYAAIGNPIALQYFSTAMQVQPNNTEPYYAAAMFQQNNDMPKLAIDTYNALLLIDSTHANAHYNMGYINLTMLNKYALAVENFSKAIEYNNRYFEAYYNRGFSFEQLGNNQQALINYNMALQINPQFDLAANGKERMLK